jgi:GMP synthase (glutamine-hydrolyzing), C-terminal domain or B subunit/GMP synthase (glutamine-hydrolyzing), N-terminal domain or A subunit
MTETILVLDFGSQYCQLIARRVRECSVYSQVASFSTSASEIRKANPKGIILSGGPASAYEADAPKVDPEIFNLGIPVLGICYGMQIASQTLGGKVVPCGAREYGKAEMRVTAESRLFDRISSPLNVWMSHGDKVSEPPEGAEILAETDSTKIAAIRVPSKNFHGIQFHPEVAHCEHGTQIIRNFCRKICGCTGLWTMASFIEESAREIREKVGQDHVILGLSGGVDSSVAAALIHKAVGAQLTCIFVDNGLLRKNEAQGVKKLFGDNFKMDLCFVDATERFLEKLEGAEEPETKRKIIGHEFVAVFADAARSISGAKWLAQGTTYPDVIESVSINGNPAQVIKSHHNVGGLPKDLKFKLLEPLARLFKDEVREVGRQLGLPESVVMRQPFPGPGLGVRHLGAVSKKTLDILREADAIMLDEIKAAGLYFKIWQAFAVFLPVRSVGVMGDCRTYDYVIALRAVESVDGMTADWVNLPHDLLVRISNRIVNEVKGVNRVVYDITSKPSGTIEWE